MMNNAATVALWSVEYQVRGEWTLYIASLSEASADKQVRWFKRRGFTARKVSA